MAYYNKADEFFRNTTPEQRASILWRHKMLARQGYYPWGKPPFGFKKVRTPAGSPTLALNKDGLVVARMLTMIAQGEIKSKQELFSFFIAETGLDLTTTRLMSILRNPAFKGLLKCDQGWVQGKYTPPVTPEVFDQAQAILAQWKSKR